MPPHVGEKCHGKITLQTIPVLSLRRQTGSKYKIKTKFIIYPFKVHFLKMKTGRSMMLTADDLYRMKLRSTWHEISMNSICTCPHIWTCQKFMLKCLHVYNLVYSNSTYTFFVPLSISAGFGILPSDSIHS